MQSSAWNPASSTSMITSIMTPGVNSMPNSSSVMSHSTNPLDPQEEVPSAVENHRDFMDEEISDQPINKDVQVSVRIWPGSNRDWIITIY